VPQGIEMYKGKYIIYSLGNFVFYQPQKHWTQRSFGAAFTFRKERDSTFVKHLDLIPILTGLQPTVVDSGKEWTNIIERTNKLSKGFAKELPTRGLTLQPTSKSRNSGIPQAEKE
jgi:poly-gamma-glutamate capsule biosynthesis protein CapA/YwtB (metallophosphatase superfamily)